MRISEMNIDVFCVRMTVSALEQKQPLLESHYPAYYYVLGISK